jgi:hypothetical protein
MAAVVDTSSSPDSVTAEARRPGGRGAMRVAWVHHPVVDVLVAFCWIPFALVAHQLEGDRQPLDLYVTSVFLLSFAHQPLTLALVYGDREQFRLRRAIFTWSPIVFAVAVFVGVQVSLVLLAVIGGLWNAEHTLMQRYGVTRIYGRKVGQDHGLVERLVLFSWLALAFVWVAADARTPERLSTVSLGQNNQMGIEVLSQWRSVAMWLVVPVAVVAVLVAVRWCRDEAATARSGDDVNPAKWLYLGSTALLFAFILVDPIAGVMGYVGAHAVEYFVIVHQSLGRRYGDASSGGSSPLGRVVRARPGRIGFFVVYLGLIIGTVTILQWQASPVLYVVVFFTLGGLHVFYDGFIWKLRRPKVAASLAIPG